MGAEVVVAAVVGAEGGNDWRHMLALKQDGV